MSSPPKEKLETKGGHLPAGIGSSRPLLFLLSFLRTNASVSAVPSVKSRDSIKIFDQQSSRPRRRKLSRHLSHVIIYSHFLFGTRLRGFIECGRLIGEPTPLFNHFFNRFSKCVTSFLSGLVSAGRQCADVEVVGECRLRRRVDKEDVDLGCACAPARAAPRMCMQRGLCSCNF